MHSSDHDPARVVAAMQRWVEVAVIGLNLCPFAKAVQVHGQIRYVVSGATDVKSLRKDLVHELEFLNHADPVCIDTTLLIHPYVLDDFYAYNELLHGAQRTLESMQLDGVIQIASFHPQYQFADTRPHDIENYTNRAPFQTLHLLRESSVERAVASTPDASTIYQRNIACLRRLGKAGWDALNVSSGS